ncbi:uncharacterized protein LOC105435696 [Cucumis sativus]|uniref:Uncharacterized protein n=1 Tax=Cucumis sativus TaxID=3659 RepID=A0A0A0KV01_CUCSA|nr:uncharacterized protein LOC105435696 [Cucumis sativus]
MDIIATSSAQNLRRLWRRRAYQRLGSGNNMSTVTTRSSRSFRVGRMMIMRRRVSPKIRLKVSSPLKVVAKIHDAYVEMMMRLANSVGNMYAIGGFGNRKRIPKPQNQVPLGGEQIDAKLVLEIYNKLAASKNSSNANINL